MSLSQGVSWIALRRSIAGPVLSKLVGLGEKQRDDWIDEYERLDRTIKSAVESLTDLGLGGKVAILGKKYSHVLDDGRDNKVPTEQIPAQRMAYYRGFDTLDDTLFYVPHHRAKLAWCRNRKENHSPLGKHFRFVMVNRADLMREFPADREQLHVDGIKNGSQTTVGSRRGRPPELPRMAIIKRAQALLTENADIKIASVAASIVAELPVNPKTGKRYDQRGIERMIAPLWTGDK